MVCINFCEFFYLLLTSVTLFTSNKSCANALAFVYALALIVVLNIKLLESVAEYLLL